MLNGKPSCGQTLTDVLRARRSSDNHCDGGSRVKERQEVLLKGSNNVLFRDGLELLQKFDVEVL